MAFTIIKFLGAFYLFYLAYKAIREKKPLIENNIPYNETKLSFIKLIRKSFIVLYCFSASIYKYQNNSKFWKITKWGKISVLSLLGLTLALSSKRGAEFLDF